MFEYKNLSEKAKEILNECVIDISLEELEEEFELMNQNRTESYCGKEIHCNYDPVAIYFATQQMLINNDSSLAEDNNKLISLTDELYPKRLLQCVLLAINIEEENKGIEIDDYESKAYFAHEIVNGIPVAFYPNIIEWVNNEKYSDSLYHGISLKKAIELNFLHLYQDFIINNPVNQQIYYKTKSLMLVLESIRYAIKNNNLSDVYKFKLEDFLYNCN